MSRKSKRSEELISCSLEGGRTIKQVAALLDLSERHVIALRQKYRENGDGAFAHCNSGKNPANAIPESLESRIITLKESLVYCDVSIFHFRKLLEAREDIKISYSALSRILKTAGVVSGYGDKHLKLKKTFGERLLLVAYLHDWFENGTLDALHILIDEATKSITGLYFCHNECVKGHIEVIRQTLVHYGIPLEIGTKYRLITNEKNEGQLGSIIEKRLGIDISDYTGMYHTKNRIKWLQDTLEKRFTRWLKNMSIDSVEKANCQLDQYILLFNDKFANELRVVEPLFVPLGGHDLDVLLAVRYEKNLDERKCFTHSGFTFMVNSKKPMSGKNIEFMFSNEIGFRAYCGGEYYGVIYTGSENNIRVHQPDKVLELLVEESYYSGFDDLREKVKFSQAKA